jgi:hypothetical protein
MGGVTIWDRQRNPGITQKCNQVPDVIRSVRGKEKAKYQKICKKRWIESSIHVTKQRLKAREYLEKTRLTLK